MFQMVSAFFRDGLSFFPRLAFVEGSHLFRTGVPEPRLCRWDWDRTFMIRMKHQVQTHRLLEPFALIHPQHPKPDDGRLLCMSG